MRTLKIFLQLFGKFLSLLVLASLLLGGNFGQKCANNPSLPKEPTIEITNPNNGARVNRVFTTSGTYTNKPDECSIWLVARPEDENLWYIQAPASIANGSWSSYTIIGREDSVDIGKKFYLFAMVVENQKEGSLGRRINEKYPDPGYIYPEPTNLDIKAHHEISVIRK